MENKERTSIVKFHRLPNSETHGKKEKKSVGAKRRLSIWLAVCFLFFIWAGVQLYGQIGNMKEMREDLAETEQKMLVAQQKQDELKVTIERLHDPNYMAELARKELYMTKEGEIIFINPNDSGAEGQDGG